MPNDFTMDLIEKIKNLYRTDTNAQKLFDWMAQRERDATFTTLDRICQLFSISRGDAVTLARRLKDANCGDFIVGRRGQKSRFIWFYSCISLGQAASGESTDIAEPENPMTEEDPIIDTDNNSSKIGDPVVLTIAEAKSALAISLGVPITCIEITVRA